MAMVDTLPFPQAHRATFSRFSPLGRRNSESMGSASNSPTLTVPFGRLSDPLPPAPFTLETLAAELEIMNTSPTSGFSYLSGDLYNPHQSRGPLQKSRSFPNALKADHKRANSPPLLRKAKSVRFADSQGLPLVEAVHQLSKQDSSYTANKIVPYSDDLSAGVKLVTGKSRSSFPINGSSNSSLESSEKSPPSSSSTLTELTIETSTSAPTLKPCQTSPILKRQNSPPIVAPSTPTHNRRFGFTQPSLEPDFFQRVNKQCVVLDNIRAESRSLQGTIRVSNLSYEKDVIVRWTHDKWRTSHDTKAVFCSNDGATDRFMFELPINGDDVTFCIRYKTCGQEFWDNNRDTNYTIFSE